MGLAAVLSLAVPGLTPEAVARFLIPQCAPVTGLWPMSRPSGGK